MSHSLSSLQKQKFEKLFNAYDTDGNGVLESTDFRLTVENLRNLLGVPEDSDIVTRLHAGFEANWQALHAQASNNKGQVTLDEWNHYIDAQLQTEGGFERIAGGLVDLIFDLFDRDKNGIFSAEEYKGFCQVYRLTGFAAEAHYETLRPNGETFDKAHLRKLLLEFYGDDADAPGNGFLGPL